MRLTGFSPPRAPSLLIAALALLVAFSGLNPAAYQASAEEAAQAAAAPPSEVSASPPAATPDGGLALDLSSRTPSILVNPEMLGEAVSATINVSGTGREVRVGDMLTPAEFLALEQVVSAGAQSLMLDAAGSAAGGSFNIGSVDPGRIASLLIPAGVTAMHVGSDAALNLSGDLVSHGTLLGLPGPAQQAVNIVAGRIDVAPGGSITTLVPGDLAALPGSIPRPVDLSLYSLSDIFNAGSITASGVLTMQAAGSIVNTAAGGGGTPVIAGVLGTTIVASGGSITNAGLIASQLGNVNLSTATGRDLVVNNLAGVLSAHAGSVSIGEAASTAKALTSVQGGVVEALGINFYGGDGMVRVNTAKLAGPVEVVGGEAHVVVHAGDLELRSLRLSGDPSIANTGGNVLLPANADSGQTLRFAGDNLAVLASGSINAPSGLALIDLSGPGDAGHLSLVAGFDFTVSLGPGGVNNYQLVGPSSTGGDINLPGVAVNTSASAGGARAGNILAVAHDSHPAASGMGKVSLGGIIASSALGAGGDVTVIAQGDPMSVGSINTSGTVAGDVSLGGGRPVATGTISFFDGTMNGPGGFDVLPASLPVDINLNGTIVAFGADGGTIAVATGGGIAAATGQSLVSSDNIALITNGGGITLGGANPLVAGGSILMTAVGAGADVSLGSGTFLSAGDSIFVLSEQGTISDGGFSSYLAAEGDIVLVSSGSITLGDHNDIQAGESFIALSDTGTLSVGNNSTVKSEHFLGLLAGGDVTVGAGNLIEAGVLSASAPSSGVLLRKHIVSESFLLVGSENGLDIGSSLTANGGDMMLFGLGGDVVLGDNLSFQAHGGYVTVFAQGQVSGSDNTFLSRAVGGPSSFRGGLIQVSSGFSFNPDILSLGSTLAANESFVEGIHEDILAAATHIASFLSSRGNIGFVSPPLDSSGFVANPLLVGSAVHVSGNDLTPGLFLPTRIGAGTIDVSNSSVDISRGAVFLDSVGSAAAISLPGSTFRTASYGLVPTGLFDHFVELVLLTLSPADLLSDIPDATITPVDQNQLGVAFAGALGRTSGGAGEAASHAGTPPRIKGDRHLAAETGAGDEPAAEAQPRTDSAASAMVETAEADMRLPAAANLTAVSSSQARAARPAGRAADVYEPIRQAALSAASAASHRAAPVQPLIKVSQRRSDLMLFTTANQVLAGSLGGNTDSVAVGSQGTAMSSGSDSVSMHTGRLVTDSGRRMLHVSTRLGTVTVNPETTAAIIVEHGRPVRVMTVGGGKDSSVVVSPRFAPDKMVKLAPGEELVMGDHPLGKEDLAPTDGIDRQAAEEDYYDTESGDESTRRLFKRRFAIEQFARKEPMVADRSMRLGGAKRAGFERMVGRIYQAGGAPAQKPGLKVPSLVAPALPGSGRGCDPLHLLASPDTVFANPLPGVVSLTSGDLFIHGSEPYMVRTALAEVHTSAGALVSVEYSRGRLRVKSCSGPGDVWVKVGVHSVELPPGRELFIADHRPSKSEALPRDGIGRRRLEAHPVDGRISAVFGDFSIVTLLNNAPYLVAVRQGASEANRRLKRLLTRTAAAVEFSTGKRGRYYIAPRETAAIPDWPFKTVRTGGGDQNISGTEPIWAAET